MLMKSVSLLDRIPSCALAFLLCLSYSILPFDEAQRKLSLIVPLLQELQCLAVAFLLYLFKLAELQSAKLQPGVRTDLERL
jgi:hypothetical protein